MFLRIKATGFLSDRALFIPSTASFLLPHFYNSLA